MTNPSPASAENWTICDPHERFLERAAKVEPGTERAFIEAQIDAFSARVDWLERESRHGQGHVVPIRKRRKAARGGTSPLADFIEERAATYCAHSLASEGRFSVTGSGGNDIKGVQETKALLDHAQLLQRHQGKTKRVRETDASTH